MQDTDALYHEIIMDRTKNPRHAGRPDTFDAEGHGENPLCGDRVKLYVQNSGPVVHHESRGCAIMTTSADLMAEAVVGLDAARIADLRAAFEAVVTTGESNPSLGHLNALAGVSQFRSRIRCATLPWSALADALESQKNVG
jgi:nitrogen fixation NifU-like protein